MPATFYTATQWRERARWARENIDQLTDASARRTMSSIAAAYERLADQAEVRQGKAIGHQLGEEGQLYR